MRQIQEAALGLDVLVEKVHLRAEAEPGQLEGQGVQVAGEVVGAHLRLHQERLAGQILLVGEVGGQRADQQHDPHRGRPEVDGDDGAREARVHRRQTGVGAAGSLHVLLHADSFSHGVAGAAARERPSSRSRSLAAQ